ncbi:acetoacetate--CoA ligase [Nocardia sp. NBC_01327]|uniref:acetoacetate--CoA ligase n=1 Tax=Nocardia sp. NBC_01327 TaxID=2903593 RepID=UPI002E1234EB|nr:acetoacetate--CoA ligase [Nocardia sp. NBC_01327]
MSIGATTESEILWQPAASAAEHSALAVFTRAVERDYGLNLPDYQRLWRWSVDHPEQFWAAVWNFHGLNGIPAPEPVLAERGMPGAVWFPTARLNFAQRVFADRDRAQVAVIAATETGEPDILTWGELEDQVAALAATLIRLGVQAGDRVAGYLPNSIPALVGFLAAASLGAIWSCCGPDYAAPAAAARLGQLAPTVLICADGYRFAGTTHDRTGESAALAGLLEGLAAVVHVDRLGLTRAQFAVPVLDWDEQLRDGRDASLNIRPVAFDHPLWVLYSSGTTGVPKAIVHGHGGVILEGLKTLTLHMDSTDGDRLFWYTTTNWMMWNVIAQALLGGSSVLLYDGSPAHPGPERLWQLAAEHDVTVLGVSPGYLAACERAGLRTGDHALTRLRLIGVTGAPVTTATFHWVHDEFDGRVPLMSMSGGTDVVSALALGAPTLPVRPGEISAPALGVALDAFDDAGLPVRGGVGELVVTVPMPSMPVRLWHDPGGSRYRDTYFDVYPGIWRHGDWITVNDHGGVVFHGRSDATLNRHGIRLGSADIYDVVEAVPEIVEALVVGIDRPDGSYWMPLFVVVDGDLDQGLRERIVDRLRRDVSPRHVPDDIIAVPAIPHTRTGKKLEVPIKRILLGADPAQVLSRDAVDDPAALDEFLALATAYRTRTR